MKAKELFAGYKIFQARVKIQQPGYTMLMHVTVPAKNREMARRLLRMQYGKNNLVTNVTEIK